MEFNEKLQELRKSNGLTQEELAQALYVSRTAVSKWESGRGYPNIDSLREISRFFSITIDELICPDEIISAAENEKKEFIGRYTALICGLLDVFSALLLLLPIYGNGGDTPTAVSLFELTGVVLWIRIVYAAFIVITVLNGVCSVIISNLDKPVWNKHRLATGMTLSVLCTAIFVLTRQPYSGIICFTILVIKGSLLILKSR